MGDSDKPRITNHF